MRTKGSKNRATTEIRNFCRSVCEDQEYRDNLRKRMIKGDAPPAVETMMHHYAYGKPRETIRVESADEDRSMRELSDRAMQLAKELLELESKEREIASRPQLPPARSPEDVVEAEYIDLPLPAKAEREGIH